MKVHAEFGSPVYIRESGLGGEGSPYISYCAAAMQR